MDERKQSLLTTGLGHVQAAQSILDRNGGNGPCPPWRRVPIQNSIRDEMRISLWLMGAGTKGLGAMAMAASIAVRMVIWLPASVMVFFAMLPIMARNKKKKTEVKLYDEFEHDYPGQSFTQPYQSFERVQTGRLLRPRYLCLADEEAEERIVSVLQWERLYGPEASLEYLFIAYTAEQFPSYEDLDELHAIAAQAAKAAGLPAYWIACSCMPNDDRALPDQAVDLAGDLYRISDVVRGSHSLTIIVGSPGNSAATASTETLLREWGRRMWTFPEVVLSPSHKEIAVYRRGDDLNNPLRVRKAHFPRLAWADASDSQQLIDHYEGLQPLGYLQLVSLGLKCLAARETIAYFQGDMVYALQGLLRCRPEVNPNDTAFQAFCRLSLANDSNHLLERLICLSPCPESAWHSLEDFWSCKLWDIHTSCQVVGVAENDSVILSGASGCSIRWDSSLRVALIKPSAKTMREISGPSLLAWFLARVSLLVAILLSLSMFISHIANSSAVSLARSLGFISAGFFAAFFVFCLPLPYLLSSWADHLKATVSGPARRSQPYLIGFEGYLDLETIETTLFGFNSGHLRWSVECSNLSRSREEGEQNKKIIGVDPYISDPEIKDLIQRNIDPGIPVGQPRVFTLVDTYNMTVTLFHAVYPPVAMLLCGTEGGLQRALLCSYDPTSRCLYRETVLRVPSAMVEKMHRVDRFRLGLKRPTRG